LLTAGGFAIGLVIGLVLAIAFELRRLFTIQTTEDAKHYTNLPVLASIPELLTAAEARAIPRRRAFAMAAGVAFAIVSIPTLAFALQFTHIFEKFLTM
jgi:ABC-type nitrate/sulfonate/bicarbonate transport system permease component